MNNKPSEKTALNFDAWENRLDPTTYQMLAEMIPTNADRAGWVAQLIRAQWEIRHRCEHEAICYKCGAEIKDVG